MKHVNRTITILVFIFLYIPMIVLAIASFNTGTDIATFKGFTFRQYANLFEDDLLDMTAEMQTMTAVCRRDGLLTDGSVETDGGIRLTL